MLNTTAHNEFSYIAVIHSCSNFVYLKFQRLESLVYIFVAACMGLSSFKFVQWAQKDASFLHRIAFWPFKVVQGHPRSMILVPIESAYTTSY